jgi:hypothetical protein
MEAFIKEFDASQKSHVMWLKDMILLAEKLGSYDSLVQQINKNPMGLKIEKTLDWPQIHCLIGMKYAKAVLKGGAWIPIQNEDI